MKLTTKNLTMEFSRKSKTSNRFTALQPLNFSLNSGELTMLMGRSGSGKSTLLNLLAGLMRPTDGKIWLDDTELSALSDTELSKFRNQHIGIIPQGQTTVYSLTVLENVLLSFLLTEKVTEKEILKAKELLAILSIEELAEVNPKELSGGELRRMAIARAMIRQPALLLADEPTADLDEENTEIVFKIFQEIAHKGTAVLIVTHETIAEQYADKLYTMKNGLLT